MTAFLAILRRLSAAPILLASLALFMLMVMTFFDVILRSVWNNPIEAATELTRILMAISVFAVLPIISSNGGHIAVDLTDGLFQSYRLSRWRDGLIHTVSGILLFWPVQRIWILAERARDYGDVTEYLALPQFYIGWFICILTAITAIAMIVTGLLFFFAPHLLVAEEAQS